jgi:hypothetical protein
MQSEAIHGKTAQVVAVPLLFKKMNLLEWLEMGYMYKYLNYKYYVLHIWYLLGIWHTIGILGKSVLGAVTPMVAPRGLT